MHHQHPGPAFRQEVVVIGRSQSGARRHGDGADFHTREIGDSEFRTVGKEQQDSLLLFQTQIPKPVARPIYIFRDHAVCDCGTTAANGDLVRAALRDMPVNEVIREVESATLTDTHCAPCLKNAAYAWVLV